MSLEINAQYAKFVMFAQQQENAATSKTIARVSVGPEAPLAGRDIAVASTDRVAPLWRRSSNRQANDAVRDLFRQSVAAIFGGEERIPQSVRDAMLMKDYGKGRPLTARRIMAVSAAVDDVLRRVAPALAQAKANAAELYAPAIGEQHPELLRGQVDALLDTLVRATATDSDALEVAVATARKMLLRGDSSLRTEENVRGKAGRLMAAVAELREAAGGNAAILAAGKAFLANMGGKDIPEGFMRDMVAAAKNLGIDRLKKLSPSSSGPAMHKALCEFTDNVNKALAACDVQSKFDGADEKVAARDFAGALMLARCGDSQARNIAAALSGQTAGVLNDLYGLIGMEGFDKSGLTAGLVNHTSAQGNMLRGMLSQLHLAAQARIGTPQEQFAAMPDANGANYDTIDGGEIFDLIVERARKAAVAHKAEFLRKAVTGEGPVADNVRKAYGRFGGPDGFDLPTRLGVRRSEILRNMLNIHVCEELKAIATKAPAQTQFALDRDRGLDVSLPGGAKLSSDFAKARDQLASFATGGAKEKYEALDATEKGKVHVMMALLNQKSALAAQNAGGLALDPDGQSNAIQFVGHAQPEMSLSVSFGNNGALKVECRVKADNLTELDVTDADGHTLTAEQLNPATKVEAMFSLTINAQELERLAALDCTTYDNDAVDARLFDPNVKNPYGNLNGTLDKNFQFKTNSAEVKCLSDFRVTVA